MLSSTAYYSLAVLIIYFLILAGIGWRTRHQNNEDDFFVSRNQLPWWVAALSTRATGESGWVFLGLSGMGYLMGASAYWFPLSQFFLVGIVWYIMARRFKRVANQCQAVTVPDIFEKITQDSRHIIKSLIAIVLFIMVICYIATQNIAAGKAFTSLLGLPFHWGVVFGSLIVLFYTISGGFKADSYTDCFQAVLMFIPLVGLPIFFYHQAGGWAVVHQNLTQMQPSYLTLFSKETLFFSIASITNGLGLLGSPQFFTRFIAIKDEKHIRYGGIVAMLYVLLTYGGAVSIGVLGRVMLGALPDSETVLPVLVTTYLPTWANGLIMVAILAAIMSTADSLLLVVSSALVHDIYKTIFSPNKSQKHYVTVSRYVTLSVGLLGLIAAFYSPPVIFWFVTFSWAGIAAVFCPLVIVIVVGYKPTLSGAVLGILLGFVTTIVWKIYVRPHFDLYELVPAFVAGFIGIILGNAMHRQERLGFLHPNSPYTNSTSGSSRL